MSIRRIRRCMWIVVVRIECEIFKARLGSTFGLCVSQISLQTQATTVSSTTTEVLLHSVTSTPTALTVTTCHLAASTPARGAPPTTSDSLPSALTRSDRDSPLMIRVRTQASAISGSGEIVINEQQPLLMVWPDRATTSVTLRIFVISAEAGDSMHFMKHSEPLSVMPGGDKVGLKEMQMVLVDLVGQLLGQGKVALLIFYGINATLLHLLLEL